MSSSTLSDAENRVVAAHDPARRCGREPAPRGVGILCRSPQGI